MGFNISIKPCLWYHIEIHNMDKGVCAGIDLSKHVDGFVQDYSNSSNKPIDW